MKMKKDLLGISAMLMFSGIPFTIRAGEKLTYIETDRIRIRINGQKVDRVYERNYEAGRDWVVLTDYSHGVARSLRRLTR